MSAGAQLRRVELLSHLVTDDDRVTPLEASVDHQHDRGLEELELLGGLIVLQRLEDVLGARVRRTLPTGLVDHDPLVGHLNDLELGIGRGVLEDIAEPAQRRGAASVPSIGVVDLSHLDTRVAVDEVLHNHDVGCVLTHYSPTFL